MGSKLFVSVYAGGTEVTLVDYSHGFKYSGSVEFFDGSGYLVSVSSSRLPLSYGTQRKPPSIKRFMTGLTRVQLDSIRDKYPMAFRVELFKDVIPELYAKGLVRSEKYKVLLPNFDKYYARYIESYNRCLGIGRGKEDR